MSPLKISRMAVGLVFLAALFYLCAINAISHGAPVFRALEGALAGFSPRSLREGESRAQQIAESAFVGDSATRVVRAGLSTALGKKEMHNFYVVKGQDGNLYRGGLYRLDTKNAELLADGIADFAERSVAESRVLYMAVPDNVPLGAEDSFAGLPVLNHNLATDKLLYRLRERGTPFLDSRYLFRSDRIPPDEITLKTGAGLTGKAGFLLFQYLLQALDQRFLLTLDPDGSYRDLTNYRVDVRSRFFMGTLGKATSPAFGGLDDFTAIAPAFETKFEFTGTTSSGAEVQGKGGAEVTILNPRELTAGSGDLYGFFPEKYFVNSGLAQSRIVNSLDSLGPKLLFIHDDVTAPLVSLLAPACSEIHTLSVQPNQRTNAVDYVRGGPFDCVVISFSAANILRPETRSLIVGPR